MWSRIDLKPFCIPKPCNTQSKAVPQNPMQPGRQMGYLDPRQFPEGQRTQDGVSDRQSVEF